MTTSLAGFPRRCRRAVAVVGTALALAALPSLGTGADLEPRVTGPADARAARGPAPDTGPAPAAAPGAALAEPGGPAAAEPVSDLVTAVRLSLLRSGEIGAARARREGLRADLGSARAAWYPEVQAFALGGIDATNLRQPFALGAGTYSTVKRGEGGASLRWTLFDFGARDARVASAAATLDGGAASLRGEILRVTFETIAGYFELLRQRELYEAAKYTLAQHQRFQERVRRSLLEKTVPLSVAALADTRVAQKIAQIQQREVDLRTAEAGFEKMTGRPAGDLEEPALADLSVMSYDAVLAEALAKSPALAAARRQVEAAQEGTRAARADQFGAVSLDLDGSAGHNVGGYSGAQSDLSAKISYRVAVFDGDLRASRRMSAAARTSEAGAKLVATQRQVEEAVAKAWAVHTTAGQARRASEDEIRAQVALLALYEQELDLGQRRLDQLLDVIDAVANARGRVASTRYAEMLAVYAVGRELGVLLSMLDLDATGIDLERAIELDASGLERWWQSLQSGAATAPPRPLPVAGTRR